MNQLEDLIGGDKVRAIRLNQKRLGMTISNDFCTEDYASIVFFGDLHYGHQACDVEKAKHNLNFALEHKMYVLGMGDYMEAGLRSSIGDSVYHQRCNPHEQIDFIGDLFEPLANAGLLLGLHLGNHSARILKETGVDPVKIICKQLKVPYLGSSCWSLFRVGEQKYTIYSLHGSTGSKYVYTKLKSIVDIAHSFSADVIAQGHVHDIAMEAISEQFVDFRSGCVLERKKYIILTGSYLDYDNTYASEKGYPIGKTGSPNIKLESKAHRIHFRD